eukprot:s1487_g14.t1
MALRRGAASALAAVAICTLSLARSPVHRAFLVWDCHGHLGLPERSLNGRKNRNVRLGGSGAEVCAAESQQLRVFLAICAAGLAALLSFAQPAAAESRVGGEGSDRRVFSVGDLHGDFQSCQKILKSLGLMGDAGQLTE